MTSWLPGHIQRPASQIVLSVWGYTFLFITFDLDQFSLDLTLLQKVACILLSVNDAAFLDFSGVFQSPQDG